MFQVSVVASGGGAEYTFGPPVKTLKEAEVVVGILEWVWHRAAGETAWPDLPWLPAVDFYEGCDVYARNEDGEEWTYTDKWERF